MFAQDERQKRTKETRGTRGILRARVGRHCKQSGTWQGTARRGEFETEVENLMKLKVIVHDAEEGEYWAEVPSIPGCATQGDTMDELFVNVRDAVEGCLSVEMKEPLPC